MCFSATASFTIGISLAVIGAFSVKNIRSGKEMLFAAIPLVFSIQQLIEGLLWLTFSENGLFSNEIVQHLLTQSYVLFVGVVWPILPSLAMLALETKRPRKMAMLPILAIGLCIAAYTLRQISNFPVVAAVSEQCITYHHPIPHLHLLLAVYVLATCSAFFISSHVFIRWLGVFYLTSFVLSYSAYKYDLTSVWCFFAAAISALIYVFFHYRMNANNQKPA